MILPVNLDIVHPHSTNTLFKSYIATAYISVMCVFVPYYLCSTSPVYLRTYTLFPHLTQLL